MDSVDFLPQRIRIQRDRRKRIIRQAYLVAVCAAALAGLAFIRAGRLEKASAQASLLDQCTANVQRDIGRKGVLEGQLRDMMVKKRIEEHLGGRVSAQLMLAEFQKLLPAHVFLTKLEFETTEVQQPYSADRPVSARAIISPKNQPKVEAIKRVRVVVTGMAPSDMDVATLIGGLTTSALFENVTMEYSKNVTIDGRIANEFRVGCYVAK